MLFCPAINAFREVQSAKMIARIQLQNCIRRVLFSVKIPQSQPSATWHIHKEIHRCLRSYFTITASKNFLTTWHILLHHQKRCFWGVDVAFNRVDEERVRLAGPDRAAAEWVLRNGGAIKWTTSSNQLNDYNMLPTTQFENYKLEEIDLSGTDVIGIGFEHLKDLHHLKRIKIRGVKTMGDDGLSHLPYVANTLTSLEISQCPMVTEKGLEHVVLLKKLKILVLHDLIEIRDMDAAVAKLGKKMPGVNIIRDEHYEEKQ